MLIRPCYRVLKAINYLCSANGTTSNIDLMVYFHQKTKDLDLNATLQQLIIDGYITATVEDIVYSDISPTYKGKHYNEYRWLTIKEMLIKSFILPIAVAFVTTLLTLAANGLFIVGP